MTRTVSAVALLAAAAVALVGCAATEDPDASSSPTPPTSPSASAEQSAEPSVEPTPSEAPWQTVTAEDGTTWQMPADWTTLDESADGPGGRVLQTVLVDAEGTEVLTYMHDLGGLGGVGGYCDTTPALETFASAPSASGIADADLAFSDAAYAIEQPGGGVVLTVGVIPGSILDGTYPACLTYNTGYHPANQLFVSFATSFTGGTSATAAEDPWYFASFDEARAFVESEAGQTMLEVVATVRLAS